jgi:hypothetical protein
LVTVDDFRAFVTAEFPATSFETNYGTTISCVIDNIVLETESGKAVGFVSVATKESLTQGIDDDGPAKVVMNAKFRQGFMRDGAEWLCDVGQSDVEMKGEAMGGINRLHTCPLVYMNCRGHLADSK